MVESGGGISACRHRLRAPAKRGVLEEGGREERRVGGREGGRAGGREGGRAYLGEAHVEEDVDFLIAPVALGLAGPEHVCLCRMGGRGEALRRSVPLSLPPSLPRVRVTRGNEGQVSPLPPFLPPSSSGASTSGKMNVGRRCPPLLRSLSPSLPPALPPSRPLFFTFSSVDDHFHLVQGHVCQHLREGRREGGRERETGRTTLRASGRMEG